MDKIVDLPIKNGDWPIKNGDLPTQDGDWPIKNGDLPSFCRMFSTIPGSYLAPHLHGAPLVHQKNHAFSGNPRGSSLKNNRRAVRWASHMAVVSSREGRQKYG